MGWDTLNSQYAEYVIKFHRSSDFDRSYRLFCKMAYDKRKLWRIHNKFALISVVLHSSHMATQIWVTVGSCKRLFPWMNQAITQTNANRYTDVAFPVALSVLCMVKQIYWKMIIPPTTCYDALLSRRRHSQLTTRPCSNGFLLTVISMSAIHVSFSRISVAIDQNKAWTCFFMLK